MNESVLQVLMVEDNLDHAFLAKNCLEKTNHKVQVARTWKECNQFLLKQKFDIILLDYNLPTVDGLTILNRLFQNQLTESPIVVVTGQGHEQVAVEALQAGAFDYVVKNNQFPSYLPEVISRVLDKHRICREKERIEKEVRLRNQELQVLNAVSEVLNQSLILEHILSGAIATVTKELDLEGGAILLMTQNTGNFTFAGSAGIFQGHSHSDDSSISSQFFKNLLTDRKQNYVFDLRETCIDLPEFLLVEKLKSAVIIPLRHKNSNLGVMVAASASEDYFSNRHLELLSSVGNQIAMAIENAQLYKQTEGLKNNLENVLNSAHDLMLTIAPDGKIVFFNQRFADFAKHGGFTQSEITGKSFFKFIPPALRGDFEKKFQDLKSGNASIYEMELLGLNDSRVPCLISQSPLKGRNEFLMIVKDISQVAQLQKQLMRSEKLSALGQMISGVAHELNNPLAGIFGYSQLLLEEELPSQVRSDVQVILRETKRCQQIVKNLLTFARRHDSEITPINTNEIVDSVLKLQSYQLKVDGIELEEILDMNLPEISGDYQQLQQVFVHLINNARDALKSSANKPKKLSVFSEYAQDSVRIRIKDNGIGIPNEYKDKIFDPFFTTKEVGEGAGLGLSICYGIVENHRGKLLVDSKVGIGSTFTIEFPSS